MSRASLLVLLPLLLLTACSSSHPPVDTGVDAATEPDAGRDGPGPATGTRGDGSVCAEEGEVCAVREDCCISRHTCFPEGCFYTRP